MGIKKFFKEIFDKYFFNPKWRCLVCGKEIFNESGFCDKCYKGLPFNTGYICAHCGRKIIAPERYCSTCKGYLTSIDIGRSVFNYEPPVSTMIKNLKYNNHRYLVDYFAKELSFVYLNNYINADYITYIPMTVKAQKKRGYNQSYLLAEKVSEIVGVPLYKGITKEKETKRQATLTKAERMTNLKDVFKIENRKGIKKKTFVIIDDVTTTGATGETVAKKLKRAGARKVCLITVASLPPKDKY